MVAIIVEPCRRSGKYGFASAPPNPANRPQGNTTGLYRVRLENGEVLLESARTPFYSAARELLKRGHAESEVLEMRHDGSAMAVLRDSIGKAAKLTVVENEKKGPFIAAYVPFPEQGIVDRHGD